MLRRYRALVAAAVLTHGCLGSAMAEHAQKPVKPIEKPQAAQTKVPVPPVKPPTAPATPAPPPDTRPYDAQLIKLAEILGALSYLSNLCSDKDASTWRSRMQALLDAEGSPAVRKERLAGAYNRGVQDYSLSYRTCTPNARVVIQRFLDEGARIARDVQNRYRAS